MEVVIEHDELVVRMHGLEQLWALCRELRIPKESITAVRRDEMLELPLTMIGWRFGMAFPWVLVSGWFFSLSRGKSFLYLPRATYLTRLRARRVLSLELTSFPRCRRAYLGYVDEPLAARIKTWANG